MNRWAIVFGMVLVAGMATAAVADKPVGGILAGPSTGTTAGAVLEGRNDYIDGWNVDEALPYYAAYTTSCFAFPYQPPFSYWLNRIEFVAGGGVGQAWIRVLVDNGTGAPNGDLLGTGSFDQTEDIVWQGADFAPCIHLVEGTTYYIVYEVVLGSHASIADSGVVHPHYYSDDCETWEGPIEIYYWMIKFFGSLGPSSTDPGSWGSIKDLYR